MAPMNGDDSGPVVVAVGDAAGSALDWGAAEARGPGDAGCTSSTPSASAGRSTPRASSRWPTSGPAGRPPSTSCGRRCAEHARWPRTSSRPRNWRSVPRSPRSCPGAAGPNSSSWAASTHRSARRLRHTLAPSVCRPVAGHARAPSPSCGRSADAPHGGWPPRVVVGVDGTGSSAPRLGVAFRAAAQRGVPLTAVHAWTPDLPADHEAVCGSVASSEARADELLHETLEPWQSRFADVPVVTRLSIGNPAAVLIRESEGAALAVVGSGARGAARRRLFGSVSRSVAQRARCPVVVVRTSTATVGERAGSGRHTEVPGVDPTRHRAGPPAGERHGTDHPGPGLRRTTVEGDDPGFLVERLWPRGVRRADLRPRRLASRRRAEHGTPAVVRS